MRDKCPANTGITFWNVNECEFGVSRKMFYPGNAGIAFWDVNRCKFGVSRKVFYPGNAGIAFWNVRGCKFDVSRRLKKIEFIFIKFHLEYYLYY